MPLRTTFYLPVLEMDVCVNCCLCGTVMTEKVIQSIEKENSNQIVFIVCIFLSVKLKPTPSWRCSNLPLPNPINPNELNPK